MRRYLPVVLALALGLAVGLVLRGQPKEARQWERMPDFSQPILVRHSPYGEAEVYKPYKFTVNNSETTELAPAPESDTDIVYFWFDGGRILISTTRQPPGFKVVLP